MYVAVELCTNYWKFWSDPGPYNHKVYCTSFIRTWCVALLLLEWKSVDRYNGFYRCDPLLKVLHTSCTMISVNGLLCTLIWACVFSIHVIKCFLSNLMYALLSEHLPIYWFLQTALHLECYMPISYWKADEFVLLRLWRRCCRFVGYAPAFIWGI